LRGFWWKLPLLFVALSVAQVLCLRFIDPPLSAFMVERWLGETLSGNVGFRIASNWRDLQAISPHLPLALVAAERAGPSRLNSTAVFDKWIACWFKLPSARAAVG